MPSYYVSEKNNYKLSFDLVDEDDAAITLAALGTLLLTNYYYNSELTTADKQHLTIVNFRNQQNVLNANNVVVSSTGAVTWTVTSGDTTKLNSDIEQELHIAMFEWHWAGKQNSQEINLYVKKVPFVS